MPIELRCTNSDCRTLLKAPDDSAGKAVKCPRCKTVVKVSEDAQPILDTLGGYELQRKLGEGGMGAVYEAVQVRLGRKVALKVLPRRFTDDEAFLERFHREARSAAALNHPNVIQVYDIDDDAGSHFFSMEYVDGESLQERLDREGRIPVEEALEITERVVDALSYAHGHSIIHRDIKPDNIMLGSDGRVKLADLGLAKKVDDEDSNITQTGASMGTPYYMSPEQAEDSARADHRADIYALGITLLHMVTGQRPFTGSSAYAVVIAHTTRPLPTGLDLGTELPPALDALIQRMSAKGQEDRYQDYDKLKTDLEKVQAGEEIISGELEASRAQTDIERESDPSAADVQNIQSARTEAAPRKRRDASRSKPSAQRRSRTVMASMKRKPPVALVGIAAAVILVIGVVWFFSRGPNSKKVSKATTTVPATIPPVIKPPAVTKKGDLLLHLPLDKVAHDVSETKAEVKLIGLGRPGDDRFNSPGDCVFFRPTDGLLIEKPPSLGAEFTVSMWVRYREIAREPWSQIVFRSRSGNRPTLSLGLMKLGPKQQMHWTARAKGESTSFAYKHDKARVHRWYHLAVTSKDGNARIYSDGVPGEARRIPELPKPDVIIIGNATGTPKNLGFTGRIDDVRIYNRALSLDELKNLFQERGWPKKTTEQPAGDGLVMHLPFDGDFKDATGNGYDGRGKDVRLGERDRKPQTIAVFNGKSVISQETLPNLKEGVTYALWAKLSSEALPERWGIVMHRLGGAENEIGLGGYPQTRGGEKRLAWSAAIEWQDEGKKGGAFLVTKQSVAAHRWYHLALTLEKGQFSFYVDGKLEVSAKGRIPFLRPGLSLGTLRGGKRQYGFIGSLDDFRVYKGALSAAEVKALFEKDGAPEAAQARRLMTHLPLDSDNKDATANGHHGQPKGIRPVEDRFGVNNRARHFDGDDLIAQQTLPSTARFTYTVWANFASDALKQGWKLVIHKNAGTRRDFILGIHRNAPDMPLTWSIAVQWGKDKRKDLIELHSRNEVMPWRWYHLAFSYADGNYQFFIDGKLDGSAKGKMPAFEPGMTLGGLKTGNSQYGFIGSLDDFRAYNHVLSPTEIEALYREGGFRVIPNAEARPGKLKKSGDHSYHVFRMPGGISWEAARDACTRMGGHLACIETKEENDFLAGLLHPREQLWIGLTDSAKEGDFSWVNGAPFTFKKWDKNQPDGGRAQNWVTFRQRGFWGDDNIEHSFICEWPDEDD